MSFLERLMGTAASSTNKGKSGGVAGADKKSKKKSKKSQDNDDDGDDAEELQQMEEARRQAQAAEAAVEAQLAAANAVLMPLSDDDDDDGGADGQGEDEGAGYNPYSNTAQNNNNNNRTTTGTTNKKKKKAPARAADDDGSIGEVSLHSSDYNDEELLQGLRDLDDELEAEFEQQVSEMQAAIARHKDEAVRLLKEAGDKPAALQEMKAAKELEARLRTLQESHEKPLGVRIDEQQQVVDELAAAVAEKKQASLAALRAGEKPTALAILKEAKALEAQMGDETAKLEELQRQRDAQMRGPAPTTTRV